MNVQRGRWGIDLVDSSGNRAGENLISKMLADTFGTSDRGTPAFSAAYWKSGDHRMVFGNAGEIGVVKLEGAEEKVVARNGDGRRAALPAWSADGSKLVYVSTDEVVDNRTDTGQTDLWTVPFNDGDGGAASAIAGASSAEYHEYYPDISADGKLVIFTRAPASETTYNQAAAEIFVIPTGGGTATRLTANDPSTAEGRKSPGVTNSWAKWAPAVLEADGATWYFVTFSSTRYNNVAQVYVAPISTKGDAITTYPAIRLPGQDPATSNHTPAWVDPK